MDGNAPGSVRGINSLSDYTMGENAFAIGLETTASGANAVAMGSRTQASGGDSVAEGIESVASGLASHAEGIHSIASGLGSHAEGQSIAGGLYAHSEGLSTNAQGGFSHAEGDRSMAAGLFAHAENLDTRATGDASHAEGSGTVAASFTAHAEGLDTVASGMASHAEGFGTSTNNHAGAHIMGRWGEADAPYSWFLANGVGPDNLGLAAKILGTGDAYIDNAWHGGGADYAEFFETETGQSIEPGYFVTFVPGSDRIRIANGADAYILGVVSAAPGFVAGAGQLRWKQQYQTDKWGRILYETVSVPEIRDESGNELVPARVESRPVLNPDYDPNRKYVPREQRPEWVEVGLLGRMLVRDDGTLVPGGFCRPNENGVATAANEGWRVLKRTDADQALILFR